jgi:hypothetical protein
MKLKNYAYISLFLLVISACSTTKKVEKNVASGNYDAALDMAYNELREDKSNEKLVENFKTAFDRANERDLKQIESLRTQNNPESLKRVYALYEQLDARQYQVITLQPLYVNGKEVDFDIKDYSAEIATSKKNYSDYLYNTASQKINSNNKLEAREAYELFNDLQYVNPDYVANLQDLIDRAKMKGSSLILLQLINNIAPLTTQDDINELTRISEANMSNPWVVYHTQRDYVYNYDYQVDINLERMDFTPEQVNTEVIPQQARVVDGWEYVYDANGNVAKDSLGNDIKRDKVITVQAEVKMFQQLKVGTLTGKVGVKNLKNNTNPETQPIQGEAKFENVYAQYRGDQRAISQDYYEALQKQAVAFPPDSLFVNYSMRDFKAKMLQYLDSKQF